MSSPQEFCSGSQRMDDLDSIVAGYAPDFDEPTRAVVADDHGDLIADRSDANGISQRVEYLVVT
jgi:hypothetical protein